MFGVLQLTQDEPAPAPAATTSATDHGSMDSMTAALKDKSGAAFDKEFINQMILHHQGAIDMANLIEERAEHDELRTLGKDIIAAQSMEIDQMKTWYAQWGYRAEDVQADPHTH